MSGEPQNQGELESEPAKSEARQLVPGSGEQSKQDSVLPPQNSSKPTGDDKGSQSEDWSDVDLQDNFVETKEPSELIFCVILSAIYAGLARYCWTPLEKSGYLHIFINIEGFFITIAMLSLLLGLRPYLSPSSLQISKYGLKYRGPYWPQRKTVNWSRVRHMYVSPELILVIYSPHNKPKSMRPLLIHSVYLADREKVADSIIKYSPIEPILVANPGLVTRFAQISVFALIVLWIANILKG